MSSRDILEKFIEEHDKLLREFSINNEQDNFLIARIIDLQQILRLDNWEFETLQFPNKDKGVLLLNEWEEKAELTIPNSLIDDIIDFSFFLMLTTPERVEISSKYRRQQLDIYRIPAMGIKSVLQDLRLMKILKQHGLNEDELKVTQNLYEDQEEEFFLSRASGSNIRPFYFGLEMVYYLLKDIERPEKHKKMNLIELYKIFEFDDFHAIDDSSAMNRVNQYFSSIPYLLDI